MKRIYGLAIFALLLSPALFAQEHYSEGPVWRISLVRVKPTHMDEYLSSLQQSSKPFLEEEKRQGVIMDYKFFIKETKHDPQDWDLCLAIEYKNHAAMDGLDAKYEAIREAEAPEKAILDFCQSTYEAAAKLAQWDRQALECRK